MTAEITRRSFLSGLAAVALGGFASASCGSAFVLSGCSRGGNEERIEVLEVAEDDVVTLESFTEVKKPKSIYQAEDLVTMDSGAILKSSDGIVAAALCTGKTARPLSTVSLVDLESGVVTPVLDQAVGHSEDYNIYAVACSQSLLAWVESNYLTDDWRVYSASVTRDRREKTTTETEYDDEGNEQIVEHVETNVTLSIGDPVQLDAGDVGYDVPELEVVDAQAYWIVQPAQDGPHVNEDSLLKMAGGAAVAPVYTSHGRFNGGLYVSERTLCVMPRAESSSGVYYQLTALQGGAVVATQVLPRSFKPSNAIYMNGSFAFSIPASYDYGGGIANVGTYYPMPNGQWLRLTRPPITPPGICNGWLYCKSGARTVFVDMAKQRYFTVDAPSESASYGDYQAAFGVVGAVSNYATIEKVDGKEIEKGVLVRRIELKQA